jgi:SAM-dependent methyltransferase
VDNAARVPADWRVILSDFSPGMLAEAVRSLERLSCPLWFALVDAQAIPFPASSFQAVIANHMLYHTSDRAKAFAEIHRVLLPEGFLYATTVGAQHMNQLHDLVRRFDPAAARQFPADVNLFTLENGSEQLAPWFPEVEVHQQDSDLIVTEVKPLVDYILSSVRLGADEEARPELTGFIRREMVQNGGAIRINKANGIFIARKAGNNTSGYPT